MKSQNKLRTRRKEKKLDFRSINILILLCFMLFILMIFMTLWFVQAIAIEQAADSAGRVPETISVARLRLTLMYVTIGALGVGLVASWGVTYWLAKPLSKLTTSAKRVANGEKEVKFSGISGYTEVEALAESLAFMTEQLARTDTLRRDLLANVSHDLRTPLTVIKTRAEMIQDMSDDKEKRAKNVQMIIDEADRLSLLVQDILDLSKIESSGALAMDFADVDFSAMTSRVVERFDHLVEKGEYEFVLDIKEGVVANVDEKRMEQVLYNLISNAIYYTGSDHKVYVSLLETRQGLARVEIKDTGKGIAPDDLEKVWQRFYRVASNAKRQTKGTGLGLAIVKTILEAHKANFGIISEVNKGSTFYFEV